MLVSIALTTSLGGFAQSAIEDSIRHIKEVTISTNRLQYFTSGNKVESIDDKVLQSHASSSLSNLLANETNIYVRNYGISGLSTPSFRGAGANHTAVLWNGFNISSSMNGGVDFSLLPVNFVNNVKLQFGGAGALWGSGAVGGTIHLNNIPEFSKGIYLSTGINYGSFEDKQQNGEFEISGGRIISSLKVFNHDAKNDYPFVNIAKFGKPTEKVTNAEVKQYGFLQEDYIRINENQRLSLRFWYQANDRNIPPSMTVGTSLSNQKDGFFRSSAEWQLIKDKVNYYVRTAYFDEKLDYVDPLISLISNSKTKSSISEAEARFRISDKQSINAGLNYTYNQASIKNYITNPKQHRIAAFASYKINNKKQTLFGTVASRQEVIVDGSTPFTASAGVEKWFLKKKIKLRGNVSRNYRIPTFNDLYWTPGGNPNLLPESGWSGEAGLALVYHTEKFAFNGEATAFCNKVDNWIIWLPDNIGLWTPRNVLSVWARGLEYEIKTSYKINNVKVFLSANYQYVQSTNERTNLGGESTLQKQLIYTPIQTAFGSIGAEYNDYRLSFTYNYVGYRFTTADNTQYLEPYQLGNIEASKIFNLENMKVRAYLQVNNFWNTSYQTIAYYPMPGRYFQAGIFFNYNQPTNKTQ